MLEKRQKDSGVTPSRPSVISIFICISIFGFLFHLIWEYVQCSPLFIHLKVTPTFWSMLCATIADIAILGISYLAVAALNRDVAWPWSSQNLLSWLSFVFFSASVAEGIEYFAIRGELWTYSSINPTIGGVSMVPLFQMAIINPLTLLVAKKLLR